MLKTEAPFPNPGSFALAKDDAGKFTIGVRIIRRCGTDMLVGDPLPGGKRSDAASVNRTFPLGQLTACTRAIALWRRREQIAAARRMALTGRAA